MFPAMPEQKPVPQMPQRVDITSKADNPAIVAQQEKARKGYESTIATSGGGLFDAAPVKKVTLGS